MTNVTDEDEIKQQIEAFQDVDVDTQRVEGAVCYSHQGNLFAVYYSKKVPKQISLRCDPLLARSLRDQFESIMPAHNLDKRIWNNVVVTEQVADKVPDLITHAYHLAKN